MSEDLEFGEGFHPLESDGIVQFRWMSISGRLLFDAASEDRFLSLQVHSDFRDFSQTLAASAGSSDDSVLLRHHWAPVSFRIPAGADHMALTLNKPFPKAYYPGDHRTLGIRVGEVELHRDERRHRHTMVQQRNLVRNKTEMRTGAVSLASTPPHLGIDMYGACNVKPPCVYCDWDHAKHLEGDAVDTPFTVDTLREWGDFFDNSTQLVNCSIGEPFMMKNFDELLDAFGESHKEVEITTNGQILTDRNIQRLVGRRINLYVSLDAGTPETYAKLRNTRFQPILDNLTRLIAAKGGPGHPPFVWLVFMPMKVNLHELPAFIDLAAQLRVDQVVLRPLNFADDPKLKWDRAGYKFDYKAELLPFDELVRASGRTAALCERAGLPLHDQLDFAGGFLREEFRTWFEEGRQSVADSSPPSANVQADAPVLPRDAEAAAAAANLTGPLPSLGDDIAPLCTEPWESLYILRRGVLPCCHGRNPIAKMDQWKTAWNSSTIQEIRRELAAGRLHSYCLESESCPIVRKHRETVPVPAVTAPQSFAARVGSKVAGTWRRLSRA